MDNLPAGWEKKWNAQYRRFYYVNHATKSTQWNPPAPPAAANWEKKFSAQYNRFYYVDHTTKKTTWEKPAGFVEADEDSDASVSSEEEIAAAQTVRHYSQAEYDAYIRNMFQSQIRSKLKAPQSLDSFLQDAGKNYPKMAQIQQKVGTAGFDKEEMLPLVDSMLHGHMEAVNRRHGEAAARVQKQAIAEIYSSFTLSLVFIKKMRDFGSNFGFFRFFEVFRYFYFFKKSLGNFFYEIKLNVSPWN